MGWKPESTSSTTWLPASSEPPNSASFNAKAEQTQLRESQLIIRSLFFHITLPPLKTDGTKFRFRIGFKTHDNKNCDDAFDNCQR